MHIHSPLVLRSIAQRLAATHHVPMIGTNHYMPLNVLPWLDQASLVYRGVGTLTYRYLVRFYNRCDFVTAPTGVALDFLKWRGLRVPSRPISNGVDLRRFRPGARDDA
jgi:glycosyltransferase involved in cell wall biosynthesis